jgi:hypothetical protein
MEATGHGPLQRLPKRCVAGSILAGPRIVISRDIVYTCLGTSLHVHRLECGNLWGGVSAERIDHSLRRAGRSPPRFFEMTVVAQDPSITGSDGKILRTVFRVQATRLDTGGWRRPSRSDGSRPSPVSQGCVPGGNTKLTARAAGSPAIMGGQRWEALSDALVEEITAVEGDGDED